MSYVLISAFLRYLQAPLLSSHHQMRRSRLEFFGKRSSTVVIVRKPLTTSRMASKQAMLGRGSLMPFSVLINVGAGHDHDTSGVTDGGAKYSGSA